MLYDIATSPVFFGGANTAALQAVLKCDLHSTGEAREFVVHTRCFYSDGSKGDTNGEYFFEQGKAVDSWLKRIEWLRERTFGLVVGDRVIRSEAPATV